MVLSSLSSSGVRLPRVFCSRMASRSILDEVLGEADFRLEFACQELEEHDGGDFLGDAIDTARVEALEAVPDLELSERRLDAPALGVEGEQGLRRMAVRIS